MKRRDILKYTAYTTGAIISAPVISSLFSSCKAEDFTHINNYKPQFFSNDEFKFIKNIVDVILPKTESPSASEVGVHKVIDGMLAKVYKSSDKNEYRIKFNALKAYLSETDGDLLNKLENLSTSDEEEFKIQKIGLQNLKQQTIAYYLSTEEIGKKHLKYLPVPGEYIGCISLEETGGKAWAI